jgi:hypothetical protein
VSDVSVTLNPPSSPLPQEAAQPAPVPAKQWKLQGPPGTIEITDAQGRRLVIKELDALAQFDLFEACGAQSNNDRYLGMAMLAASVFMIDNDPVPFPKNRIQLRNLVGKLGSDAIRAIADAMKPPEEDDDTVVIKKDAEIAKN